MPVLNKLKEDLKHEIIGITLIALAILILLSIINPSVGVIGKILNDTLMFLAGEGRFLLPILLAIFGYKMLYPKKKLKLLSINLYGAIILTVVLLTLLHFSVPSSYSLTAAIQGDGGGIIGGLSYFILLKSFGMLGLYIILTALFLVGTLLMINQSIIVIFKYIVNKAVNVLKKTIHRVDNFLFADVEDEDNEECPIIIERCNEDNDIPDWLEEGADIYTDNENQMVVETLENTPKDNRSNVRYYRPLIHTMANKIGENYEEDQVDPLISPAEQDNIGEDIQDKKKIYYKLPHVSLLAKPSRGKKNKNNQYIADNINKLEETLNSFGIKAKVSKVSRGPAITRYEIQPPLGVKVSRIVGLADDIALSMAAPDVRIEAPIPGKAVVGIEVPNKEIATVYLRDLVETVEFKNLPSYLTIALGLNIAGKPIVDDLSRMPHLLIAGATGAGKSVCLNTLICSIIFKSNPEQVKLLIIDPKMVELTTFNGIPHLVSPVVTDPKKAATSLRWAVKEMEYRYELFAQSGVRDIVRYNILMSRQGKISLPLVVIIIDELADLMMIAPADVEDAICRLAQMARAAGIHLVVATQRPSVDIITGLIKANIPSRISFAVSSQIDSRTILDMGGAEKLLGQGDMLYCPVGAVKPIRVQGAFLSDREVENLAMHWKQQSTPKYYESISEEISKAGEVADYNDELLGLAVKMAVETGHASISLLQRRLHIGYARAARLMDVMEKEGYVGGYEGSKPRSVLITEDEYSNQFLDQSNSQVVMISKKRINNKLCRREG